MILRNIADTLEVFSSTRVVWKPSFWPKHDIFMNPLFSDERSDLSWLISDSPFQRKAYHKRDEERQRESKICMFWCPREEPGCGAEPEAPRAAPALPSPRTGCRGVPTPCLSKQGARTGSHRSPHSPPAPRLWWHPRTNLCASSARRYRLRDCIQYSSILSWQ